MSIALVIANISGSIRSAAPSAGAPAPNAGASATPSTAAQTTATSLVQNNAETTRNDPQPSQEQLTPAFSVLVLQVLNDRGEIIATVPTAQQLAAYRNGTAAPPA